MSIYRERALLFDREAERYDRTRPGYPDELIDEVIGQPPSILAVLDVGCGTGIAARALARRGASVIGVELNPNMAKIAERHGIPVEISAFEAWDPGDRTFDRVTCAQAWHWLDPQTRTAKAASVLRPGGRLCLFWNVGGYPDHLRIRLQSTYDRVLGSGTSGVVSGYASDRSGQPLADFDVVCNEVASNDELTSPRTSSFPWKKTYTRDEWVDELGSHSDHAALEPGLRGELLGEIGRTIDTFGGTFEMPYVATLISAERR